MARQTEAVSTRQSQGVSHRLQKLSFRMSPIGCTGLRSLDLTNSPTTQRVEIPVAVKTPVRRCRRVSPDYVLLRSWCRPSPGAVESCLAATAGAPVPCRRSATCRLVRRRNNRDRLHFGLLTIRTREWMSVGIPRQKSARSMYRVINDRDPLLL